MKNKKTKLFMSLSILIICLLVSSLSFDSLNSKALTEKSQNHYDTVSFDRSDWEWNMTEVISEGSTGDSYSPSLVADNAGNMHVTWHDNTNYAGSGSDFDIFYRYWNNFSCVTKRITKGRRRLPIASHRFRRVLVGEVL